MMASVLAVVRLCSAVAYPCRAKLRARLRPITPSPVTPICAVAWAAMSSSSPLLRRLSRAPFDHAAWPAGCPTRMLAPLVRVRAPLLRQQRHVGDRPEVGERGGGDHRADRLDHAVGDVQLHHVDHPPGGVVLDGARLAVDP